MTPKEAWDSYVESCKKAGIKPGPYRNLLENEDEPKKKRRDGIAAASAQKRKENMAKQKRLGNLEIAEALGIRIDHVGPLKDLAGISRQGPIMESRLEQLRKYLDALPPMQQEEEDNGIVDTEVVGDGTVIGEGVVSGKGEEASEEEDLPGMPPFTIHAPGDPEEILGEEDEKPDGPDLGEYLGGFDQHEFTDDDVLRTIPQSSPLSDAGMENRFTLSKRAIVTIAKAAMNRGAEEALRRVIVAPEISADDVLGATA
ncbi:hypothetical protein ACM66T_10045 [Sulfurimonas sp. ST-25]|uniref:hypothetical protein n=1 Tax=Sulfurimonas sp. ST-25 TaxID=3400151 RepID=UPI003A846E57